MPDPDLTRLFDDAARAAPGAADRLLPAVYEQLRAMARRQLAGDGGTFGPTALVHEAWLRLVSGSPERWRHRAHFFGAAAQAMRRILVEHARARRAQKRGGGGGSTMPLDDCPFVPPDADQLLDLDAALQRLELDHPREARVVLLRYFAGLQIDEVATVLTVSVGTVERDWRLARARLQRVLGRPDA
ncbi:MAG: sigma-70 family RNA polymerase sigma factor [Planctomycetes bacterium]|nr:sigma-70 family RNA polymerase sigma factor [Planctomycetota bacterium]